LKLRLGIDIARRAAHRASLADERGQFLWTGKAFRTTAAELERLWAEVPDAAEVTVVMEPTRNAWVPLAAWFRRHGATVVLVPPERASDLCAYYAKHTKTDPLDSRLLARLPLLHPEGLHAERGLGRARLDRFLARHSRSAWGTERADELLAAAAETAVLWGGELDHPALGEDIALEARRALRLDTEIKELDGWRARPSRTARCSARRQGRCRWPRA